MTEGATLKLIMVVVVLLLAVLVAMSTFHLGNMTVFLYNLRISLNLKPYAIFVLALHGSRLVTNVQIF